MFTVTHFIQAAIPVSTCCAVSSIERILNLRSYHIQHPTSALSTINLNAPNKSYRCKTQQAVPNEIHIAALLATAWLYLKCLLRISYLRNLVHWLTSSEKSTLHIFNYILTTVLQPTFSLSLQLTGIFLNFRIILLTVPLPPQPQRQVSFPCQQ